MDNRSLTQLLSSIINKLTWFQIRRIKQFRPNKKDIHSLSLISETYSSKRAAVTKLPLMQKYSPTELNKVCAHGFSTSTNHNFWNKLTALDQQKFQAPAELYAQQAEVEPLLVEGVGWAGQPIVRRIHPILPEVYGDLSDIFTAVKKVPVSSKAHDEALLFSEANGGNKTIFDNAQSVNLRGTQEPPKDPQLKKDYLDNTNKTKKELEVKSQSNSSDAISIMDIKSGARKHLHSIEVDSIPSRHVTVKDNSGIKRKTEGQVTAQVGLIGKKTKRDKKLNNKQLNSGPVLTKQKKKSKKKTKVLVHNSKTDVPLTVKTKKTKKKKVSMLGGHKKKSLQPNIIFNQRASDQAARRSVMILANRQIQTYSQANQAKVSINVKEKTSTTVIALAIKQKKSPKLESEGKYPEDCKCPETLETKTRFPTKICGEAAGAQDKKKKKEWKGKMCPIEHKLKHRRRTFVCNSAKFIKGKRKRQLPKCVKPEKKIASRVLVCPPVLEDELKKGEKKCIKQVEEVKTRSRTKVCKPIIMYQKEEATVAVQKSVCIEKKVQKTISRHTKVCPPSEQNGSQKKVKR